MDHALILKILLTVCSVQLDQCERRADETPIKCFGEKPNEVCTGPEVIRLQCFHIYDECRAPALKKPKPGKDGF